MRNLLFSGPSEADKDQGSQECLMHLEHRMADRFHEIFGDQTFLMKILQVVALCEDTTYLSCPKSNDPSVQVLIQMFCSGINDVFRRISIAAGKDTDSASKWAV